MPTPTYEIKKQTVIADVIQMLKRQSFFGVIIVLSVY